METRSGQAAAPETKKTPRRTAALVMAAALCGLCAVFWADVLFGGRVLLPGAMLRGFAPWGGDPSAPWSILQWDALAQYFPWRTFAARELASGRVPLWNPHQFSGAPFLANGQSAVLYPLSLPFWIFDTARAFGIAAFLHSLLALAGAFALLRRWGLARSSSLAGALAWAWSGYLAEWNALPTLAHTASWLPLLVLLFERAAEAKEQAPSGAQVLASRPARVGLFAIALSGALLAGHAQIFLLLLAALAWRALTLEKPLGGAQVLAAGGGWAALLGAAQLLPTLELARLGHRAGATADAGGWADVALRALQPGELIALFVPGWPMLWLSLNENFPYSGAAALLLALVGAASVVRHRRWRSPQTFALGLAVVGLGTALAWPPAKWLYFGVPGAAQFGGLGRALVLWSFGAALLAAFGLEVLRRRFPARAPVLGLAACALITLELGANGWSVRKTSSRQEIYPRTALTDWLQQNVKPGERIAFVTPRNSWRPSRFPHEEQERPHPPGVLPPNGAMVYGLHDVGGYDSLAPAAYRKYLQGGEAEGIAPRLNGNILLPANFNSRLSDLNVRYTVTLSGLSWNETPGVAVFEADNCTVWKSVAEPSGARSGRDFSPGWRNGKYQPQTFRVGVFLSLCALAALASTLVGAKSRSSVGAQT
jgi:lambda repressor-like predicted transcriptional regulator